MFDAYCPHHDGRVLLTTRHILRMDRTPAGTIVRFRCWCGEIGLTAVPKSVSFDEACA